MGRGDGQGSKPEMEGAQHPWILHALVFNSDNLHGNQKMSSNTLRLDRVMGKQMMH